MGPENIALEEAAKRLTVLTDKPISYFQQSISDFKVQINSCGFTGVVEKELVQLFEASGDSDGVYATPRTPETTPSTGFDQFVKQKILPML